MAIDMFLLTVVTEKQKQRWKSLLVFWIRSHKKRADGVFL